MLRDTEVKEIYGLFTRLGVPPQLLDKWMREIVLDDKKTETRITDLLLCVLIHHGFKPSYLKRLTVRLLPRYCRPRRLLEKMDYLSKYVVNTTNEDNF